MSGGSFNYLYNSSFIDILSRIDDLIEVYDFLIDFGYKDIADDVYQLIENCKYFKLFTSEMLDHMSTVFHDIEWFNSCDISFDNLKKTLDKYERF